MNTVTIQVEETFQEAVQSVRLLVLEIPADSPRDPEWLRRVLHHGAVDFGPFPTRPIEGALERRWLGIRVIGETNLPRTSDRGWPDEAAKAGTPNSRGETWGARWSGGGNPAAQGWFF